MSKIFDILIKDTKRKMNNFEKRLSGINALGKLTIVEYLKSHKISITSYDSDIGFAWDDKHNYWDVYIITDRDAEGNSLGIKHVYNTPDESKLIEWLMEQEKNDCL